MEQNINDIKFCTRCGTRLPKSAVICYKCNMKQNISPNMQDSGVNLSKEENVRDVSFREVNPVGSSSEYSASAAENEKFGVDNAGFIVLIAIAVAAAALFVSMVMTVNRDKEFYNEYKEDSQISSLEISEKRDSERDVEKVESTAERREESSRYDSGWDETAKKGVYEAGDYEIGTEIPDGVYIVLANDESDHIAYQSILDGDNDDGGWFQYSIIVNVSGEGIFETIRATAYSIETFDLENDPFEHSGMFRVGVDVEPGTYRAESISDDSYGMWTVHDSVYEIDYDKIYKDGHYGSADEFAITVEEGQILQLNDCRLVK